MQPGQRFLIQRSDLQRTQFVADPDAPDGCSLSDQQARLSIGHFALTANNLTYAAFGGSMKYWQFFPAADPAWGCLPVWGFATVVESRIPGLAVGRRVYGCLPAGTHLVVQAERVSATGFQDISAHRTELAAVYSRYDFCDADPLWRSDAQSEGLQAVLKPLFVTSFLIDDFMAEQGFYGALQILMSSASSKTAMGTAFCLGLRRLDLHRSGLHTGHGPVPRLLGLTSAANLDFTRRTGLYEQVLDYTALALLDASVPTVYIDFAGDAALRRQVHSHFDGTLAYSCSVGGTHWQALGSGRGLPGPPPVLFFAPAQVNLRSGPPPHGWGPGGLQAKLAAAWGAFLHAVQRPEASGLRIVHRSGHDALAQAYAALAAGKANPSEGLMLSLQAGD